MKDAVDTAAMSSDDLLNLHEAILDDQYNEAHTNVAPPERGAEYADTHAELVRRVTGGGGDVGALKSWENIIAQQMTAAHDGKAAPDPKYGLYKAALQTWTKAGNGVL